MFCSVCLHGNDKNETALRGLNLWVLNFIESNLVKKFVAFICEIELPRETSQNIQIFEVNKLDLIPMVGAIGESWSNLITSVVNKNKYRSSQKGNLRD